MKIGLSILFTAIFVYTLQAQRLPDPVFHTLEAEMLGVTKAIHQTWDSNGRLWVVTEKGLVRFDGYQSVFFPAKKNTEHAPLSDNVRSLIRVQEDEFWLSYSGRNDLSMFNPITNKYTHFFVDSTATTGYPDAAVTKILAENDSIRWIATWGQGLCRMNVQTGRATNYLNRDEQISDGEPPTNFIKEILKLDDDLFLAGFFFEEQTNRSIPHYFKPSTGTFTPVDFETALQKHDERMQFLLRVALNLVNFIYIDPNENYWIGSYIGLVRWDTKKNTLSRVSAPQNDLYRQNLENTRTYVVDPNGLIWITTPNQGILLVDPLTGEVHYVRHQVYSNTSIADDRMSSINLDPNGNIWVASEAGTFSICNPLVQQFQLHTWNRMNLDFTDRSFQQIPVNQLLVQPNGKILISSATGILEYDPKNRTSENLYSPAGSVIVKGENDRGVEHFRKVKDLLYFTLMRRKGEDHQVAFNMKTRSMVILDNQKRIPRLLFRHGDDSDPVLFYAGWVGPVIKTLNPETGRLDSLVKLPDTVAIAENFTLRLNSGKWMFPLANAQIGILNPATGQLAVYHRKSQDYYFPDSTILCGYKDPSGTVWIGTQTGIYAFTEDSKQFTKKNKLIGLAEKERVNAIIQDDDGVFWIALSKDLLRWDPAQQNTFRFTKAHGISAGSFLPAVAQKDTAGNIYIATYNGILIFDPHLVRPPEQQPKLQLASARLFEKELELNALLNASTAFANNENFLTFEFYTNEVFTLLPNHFYFKLTGRDKDWQDNGVSNRIRLADLSSGSYTLEVKAVNAFNRESEVLQIPFTIAKPFWQTWWFILICITLLALLTWIYIKHREKALRKKSLELEKTVRERTAEVVLEKQEADKQRLEAEHQKEIVEEKQKEISDSINYAKRIQNAILPSTRYFKSNLPESFILYLPKDVVAGDFYFMETVGETVILAVADCTGHGVPGAMVSVVCHNALTRSVKEFGLLKPNEILDKTRELVLETFAKSEDQVNDGMDIALCAFNTKTRSLQFSGANNGLFLVRNGELTEYKPDKQPIGKFIHAKPFTAQEIPLVSSDRVYLFTDGYADQFGGEAGKPGGKKFKYSRLKALIQEIHLQKPEEQHDRLAKTLVEWRGEIEQIDDVCIIGFNC